MVDLTFVTFEEIQAELARRYPAFVLCCVFHGEGQKVMQERISWGGKLESSSMCYGLAHSAVDHIRVKSVMSFSSLPPGPQPLDPPR